MTPRLYLIRNERELASEGAGVNVTRRGFLKSILAASVAPAIVRADALMRIVPRDTTLLSTACVNESPEWLSRLIGCEVFPVFDLIDVTTLHDITRKEIIQNIGEERYLKLLWVPGDVGEIECVPGSPITTKRPASDEEWRLATECMRKARA